MRIAREHVHHPDRSLRLLRLELDAFAQPRHAHRHVELTWIERGAGLRLVGDNASAFESGDLVLLGPEVPHTWVTTDAPAGPRPCATVLQFAPEWLTASASPELRRATPVLQAAARGLTIGGAAAQKIQRGLHSMPSGDDYQRLAGLVAIVGHLVGHPRDLRPICARCVSREADATAGTAAVTRRVDRVIDWMQRHLAQELAVEQAATLAHVSPAAFSRWFRREVGKTFTQYLNDLRFGAACVKLRETERPVAAVACEVGFATLSHFNQQFRRRAGMSPREFRAGKKNGSDAEASNPSI
jgi:AraC-like DNA-binding protein